MEPAGPPRKKGEKGIRILAPIASKAKNTDETEPQDTRQHAQPVRMGFRAVYVFDVSQTEGDALPSLTARVTGDVGTHRERLIEFIAAQGIELEFSYGIAPALGMSYGGRIAVFPGQNPAEEFSTLVHELAHELCHRAARRSQTTKTMRETEAEAVAFVVSQAIGLDAGHAAADYIQLYRGTPELLMDSFEVIQRTSAAILDALAKPSTTKAEETAEPLAQAS